MFQMNLVPSIRWLSQVKLERCSNESYCLPTTPKLVTGLRASTADIFCDNAAYRQFLFEKFGVSTVDEESSAIVMVIWFVKPFFSRKKPFQIMFLCMFFLVEEPFRFYLFTEPENWKLLFISNSKRCIPRDKLYIYIFWGSVSIMLTNNFHWNKRKVLYSPLFTAEFTKVALWLNVLHL